jgi:dephospho-CoA kinase
VSLVVGLTGGIGSGKTTVANRLQALGADVVDTDDIARAITQAHGEAMPALRDAFGPEYVTTEGALDRAAMRALAFRDSAARERLEAILHPAIRRAADEAVGTCRATYERIVLP